jgi:hypothetical protein
VHVIVIALDVAVPEHVCGPVSEILPSAVTVPVKPLKGAANVREHELSVTTAAWPTRDASQCWVTFQLPLTSGQPEVVPDGEPELELELELHATTERTSARTA